MVPTMDRYYVTTAIPYVNGAPHVGHALELVQADTLARYHREAGDEVRAQTGTDDNALKNVLSARAAGLETAEYVDLVSRRFLDLAGPLGLSFDDSVRTAFDPRHRPGVERLWNACLERGDLYRRSYTGLYCTGCEQFYTAQELPGGLCPEHRTAPEEVAEETLLHAADRVVAAARTAGSLLGGREPLLTPGSWCGWCPRAYTCPSAEPRSA